MEIGVVGDRAADLRRREAELESEPPRSARVERAFAANAVTKREERKVGSVVLHRGGSHLVAVYRAAAKA